MDNITPLTKEYFKVLPPDLQKFITDSSWRKIVSEISKKYNLSDEQSDNLETEVFVLLLGLTNQNDLIQNISDHISISSDKATEISKEINLYVLKDIAPLLTTTARELENNLEESIRPKNKGQAPDNLPMLPPEHEIAIMKIDAGAIYNPQPAPGTKPLQSTQPQSQTQPTQQPSQPQSQPEVRTQITQTKKNSEHSRYTPWHINQSSSRRNRHWSG